jgi:hypothetical protein
LIECHSQEEQIKECYASRAKGMKTEEGEKERVSKGTKEA